MKSEAEVLKQELDTLRLRYKALQLAAENSRQAASTYHQLSDIEQRLNRILGLSLQRMPLLEVLELALEEILQIPWFALEPQGCIFLLDHEHPDQLRMRVHRNLSPEIVERCSQVPFGHCLCGRAAQQARAIFKAELDHEHEVVTPTMREHGHHVLPLVAKGQVLGVLTLYLRQHHQVSEAERQFLDSIAAVLSAIILNKEYERTLARQSFEDELTDLPNRRSLLAHLERTIDRVHRSGERFAVFFLDLDRFKPINDTYGHDKGDLLLRTLAERLRRNLRTMDLLARLGGDEFVIVTELMTAPEELRQFAERIVDAIEQPFDIDGKDVSVSTSIGIALFPDHGSTPDQLLRQADKAMYTAKSRSGPPRIVFCEDTAPPDPQ